MAAVVLGVSTASTSNASSYASGSFTPAANDLLVVFVAKTASVNNGTMSDSLGGAWTFIQFAQKASSADRLVAFVRDSLAPASAMTVTYDCTGDAATGAVITVLRVSGMSRTGSAAVRRNAFQDNQAASTTPAPVFSAACLTGNPTLGCVFNATNPATLTPPTNWTERNDTGYGTPTTGSESVSRDSGFTGTTITWGGTSASAFGSLSVELDSSLAEVTGTIASTAADATSSASGTVTVSGSIAQTAENATSAASGTVTVTGTIAATAANATGSATGEVGTPSISGTIAATAESAASSASGTVTVSGTAAASAGNATSAASGTVSSSGSIAAQLADATGAASGTVTVSGSLAGTAQNATASASGSVTSPASGSIAVTLQDATSAAQGMAGAQTTVGRPRRYQWQEAWPYRPQYLLDVNIRDAGDIHSEEAFGVPIITLGPRSRAVLEKDVEEFAPLT